MRGNLYRVLKSPPEDLILKTAQKDIIDNWLNTDHLFSVTQIAERNNMKRGAVHRQIISLQKRGVVDCWNRKRKVWVKNSDIKIDL